MGLDEAQFGEFAYDYVELRRDLENVIFEEAKVADFAAGDRRAGVYSSGGSVDVSMEMPLMPVSLRDEEQFQGERDHDV